MEEDLQTAIPAYEGDEPFIFISYSHADREKVMYFIRCMNESGYRVWYDEGIKINDDYQNTIQRKIRESSYFIAFITKRYLSREDPLQEMLIAMDLRNKKKLKIIPIVLEEYNLEQLHENAMLFDTINVEEALGKLIYQNFKDIQGFIAYENNFNNNVVTKVMAQIDDSCRTASDEEFWQKTLEEDTLDAYLKFLDECNNYALKELARKRVKEIIYENKSKQDTNEKNEQKRKVDHDNDKDSDRIGIGEILDKRYKIVKILGRGGMGTVYLASDSRLSTSWAIKEIKLHNNHFLLKDMATVEVNLMKQFNHHSIPRVVDLITKDDAFYIVMDYIEGRSLDSIIAERGALSEKIVIKWANELCNVLSYLHSRKPAIIFRDVKPANIAIKTDGRITLMDFGIAREYKPGNVNDTVMLGTRGYAAPEQYLGNAQTDERTDIYSLGVTLYYLVTALSPNNQPYEMVPIRKINPNLSRGLEKIILKCTKQNPDERYQSCKELMNDLKIINYHPLTKIFLKITGRKIEVEELEFNESHFMDGKIKKEAFKNETEDTTILTDFAK
ncbi:protein kinase domain-containing protein [Metabacillus bambusae]|uniref:non-specific serine/threonine protein kinase n=1 Tax=Metabacillus bambusae TaxID=2795218 RepID=A0ABS3MZA0_9BACI|nr:protein kinase [Metabacillus bambusae]MBO1511347.1 protein kinase [Metabacillus bambusae]